MHILLKKRLACLNGYKKCIGVVRACLGRSEETSFCIIDAQNLKNTDTAKRKATKWARKSRALKTYCCRYSSLIHAIAITTADITDRAGVSQTIKHYQKDLSSCSSVRDYTGKVFAHEVKTLLRATVQIAKRSELRTFAVMPKCWLVERTFAWLE